jgi:hypothetical protein
MATQQSQFGTQQQQQQYDPQQQQLFQPKQVTWTQVRQPGCYVDTESGNLYRVPPEAINGSAPTIHRETKQQPNGGLLVMISENPFLPSTQARMLAAQHGIEINF